MSNFFVYVNDGNETFGTIIHAENLIKYGYLNFFMTDESTGTMLSQHPITHLSQGNWPRIPVAFLKLLNFPDQLIIFTVLITLNLICFYVIYSVLITKTSKEFAFIFIFTIFFNYLHYIQWSLNLYRVWQSISYFVIIYLLSKLADKKYNKSRINFLIIAYLATIGYGELIYAFWLFISTTFLIFSGFFSQELQWKVKNSFIIFFGVSTGFVCHIFQGVSFIGINNFALYFFNILGVRNGYSNGSRLSTLVEEYNLVFWENYGIPSQSFIDQMRILKQSLINLISYSYIIQYIIPLILVLIFMSFKKRKNAVVFGLIINFYLLMNSTTDLKYLILIFIAINVVLYKIHLGVFKNVYGISLLITAGFSLYSTVLPTRSVFNQLWVQFVLIFVFAFVLFLLILRLKNLNILEVLRKLNSHVTNINFYHKTQVLSLTLCLIWLQSNIPEQILNFIYLQNSGFRLYLIISFTLLYVFFLVLLPFNLEFVYPPLVNFIAKFLFAPTAGLVFVFIFSPGYLFTGYLFREDLLWKGFVAGYISFFIYVTFLNVKRYTLLPSRISSIGFLSAFSVLYIINQLTIAKIQPPNAFKDLSSYIQENKYGEILYSNSYSLPLSYLSQNYSAMFSQSQLISFFETENILSKNYSFQFPDRTSIIYKNYDSYFLLDIPVNFDSSLSRFSESGGKPMPSSSYCNIVYERDFSKHYDFLELSNLNNNGKIGNYGYWCDFIHE